MAFDEAQLQGNGSWRVPTKDELATLIGHTRQSQHQSPSIDILLFPDMDKHNPSANSGTGLGP